MSGITTQYMCINLDKTNNSEVSDCYSRDIYGKGCFTWDNAVNVKFARCEASRAYNGTTGDGFNASATGTGDNFSKQCTATLIDCWSHDNRDDGYSIHYRCEDTIIGGLYEWNGKAGITPSFGSHCDCFNAIARNNYNGFYFIGTNSDTEGGVDGQMLCVNCTAINNTKHPTTYGDGFRVGDGNQVTLIGCKSIANKYGYRSGEDCILTMYDCTAKDNASGVIHSDSGTINIVNTDPVTSG